MNATDNAGGMAVSQSGGSMRAFGNVLLATCLVMAGGWIWLTSTLHQERSATVWLTAGALVVVGIVLRYFFAIGSKA